MDVLAWRMQRQHLTRRSDDALSVISDVCGLHAQVLSTAATALWARLEAPPDLDALLWESGELVKTWAMRGTLHLLLASELPLYVGAQGALKPRTSQPTWLRHFELTADDAQAILDGVPAALRDGPLTREELAERVHEGLRRGYGDLLKAAAPGGHVRLLPAFDQFVVAAPRDSPFAERIYRPGGWFSPVLLVDGAMAGVWASEGGAVRIEPFESVGAEVRVAAEAEAARLPGASGVEWV